MADTMEEAERRIAKSVNGVTGIPTGLTELDKKQVAYRTMTSSLSPPVPR